MPPEMRDYTPKSKGLPSVHTSWEYVEIDAAHEWGMSPAVFESQDMDTRAKMIAYLRVKNTIDRFYSDKADERANRNAKSPPAARGRG